MALPLPADDAPHAHPVTDTVTGVLDEVIGEIRKGIGALTATPVITEQGEAQQARGDDELHRKH